MKKFKKRFLFLVCAMFVMAVLPKASQNVSAATKKYTVKIYDNPGKKVQKQYKVAYGQKVTLPSIYIKNGKTLLGYSSKKGTHSNPAYLVGQTITVKKNINLYNVIYYTKNEKNLSASALYNINNVPYKNVIFVGDSRTYYLFERELSKSKYPAQYKHIYHIALSGSGLAYMKGTAYSRIISLLKTLDKEKTAIVFNHGVNDMWNINSYITYMNKIAPTLKKYNCRLFYMSVNPLSVVNRNYWNKKHNNGKTPKKESDVWKFNSKIKNNLCGSGKNYTYIDTCSYLNKYGYSYYYDKKHPSYNDGVHYTAATGKRIYQYVMKFLKTH